MIRKLLALPVMKLNLNKTRQVFDLKKISYNVCTLFKRTCLSRLFSINLIHLAHTSWAYIGSVKTMLLKGVLEQMPPQCEIVTKNSIGTCNNSISFNLRKLGRAPRFSECGWNEKKQRKNDI